MIGARGNGHDIVREPFNSLRANGIGPYHHAQVIPAQEGLKAVRSKADHVVLLLRVSHVIMLETCLLLSLVGVTPQQVNCPLQGLGKVSSQLDLEGSRDLFNLLDILERGTYSSVNTQNLLGLISNESGNWEVVEGVIDSCKHTVGVRDVFT